VDRRARILGPIDPARLKGLEIGPRHAPLVGKHEGDVLYVDYATTETLRAGWDKPHLIDPASFVEVDIVWGRDDLPVVDYVVASHVVEHVPDLAGWLAQIRGALRPGGRLCLAVPDRRFTFDVCRTESTLAEVVEARLMGYTRPSIRQVFDSYAFTRPNNHQEAWARDGDSALAPMPEKISKAFEMVRTLANEPRYIDSHCWVFTPRSFLGLAKGMRTLGWFPFALESFQPTGRDDFEFVVRLVAEDDGVRVAESLKGAVAALGEGRP
jgi:SAM-dependent methyltransferase